MSRKIETIALEVSLNEGKNEGLKEFDEKLQKILDKYREDLTAESASMVNDIVHALHMLKNQNHHRINQLMIEFSKHFDGDVKEILIKEVSDEEKEEIVKIIEKLLGGK